MNIHDYLMRVMGTLCLISLMIVVSLLLYGLILTAEWLLGQGPVVFFGTLIALFVFVIGPLLVGD